MQRGITMMALVFACHVATAADDLAAQRKHFEQAEAALKKGDTARFRKLKASLRDYPLAPYLRYAWLSDRLRDTPDRDLRAFIKDHRDSPLGGRLRTAWLKVLAKQRRWRTFLDVYSGRQSDRLRCLKATAGIETRPDSKLTPKLRSEIEALWLHGRSRPDSCDRPFAVMRNQGFLSDDLVWRRIELAMQQGQTSLAKYLKRYLKDRKLRRWTDRWVQLRKKPADTLKQANWPDSPTARVLVDDGIRRLARRNATQAHLRWQALQSKYRFTAAQHNAIDAFIAVRAALQQLPQARDWLQAVANPAAETLAWSLRAALADGDWDGVTTVYQAMDADQQAKDQWRYWQARALEARGDAEAASALFKKAATGRGYHSFLAADRIDATYAFGHQSVAADAAEQQRIVTLPPVQRARELYQLKRYWEARGEWAKALRGLDPAQLRSAARVAADWGWDGRVITTLARAKDWDDVELRFPLSHDQQVITQAGRNGLDPSWVFGVIRQESTFMTDARSPAGARGLMQLMPATGRETARLLKAPLRDLGDLYQPTRNIQLGSAYMKRVLNKLGGNMVLATAAYNAGPSRVRSWLPDQSEPAELWVERIPFRETRRYVKKVLAFASVYDWRRKVDVTRVSDRMRPVKAP